MITPIINPMVPKALASGYVMRNPMTNEAKSMAKISPKIFNVSIDL